MAMTLVWKEIKENRWAVLTIFIFSCVITPFYPYSYGSLFAQLLSQGTTYESFLWYDWFFKALPQLAMIAAILMGATTVAREKKNDTLGILVTRPISRTGIWMAKLGAGSVFLLFLLAGATFVLALVSQKMGARDLSIRYLLFGLLGDVLLVLPVYLMSAAFSVILSNSIKAGLLTTGIAVVFYGPGWVGSKFSILWWLLGGAGVLNLWSAVILAAAGCFFVWLGMVCFNRLEV